MLGAYRAFVRRLGGTAWFAWLGIHVLTPVDRWLFRRFHGRVVSVGQTAFPVLELTTIGRRSGLPRRTPLVFHTDREAIIVVATNWGQTHHPGWSANLLSNSRASVDIRGSRL